ncbi:MAG: Trm112 family protein [Deltaproteobacteria bacterium]|nr:Trm112 family protein [Deltaproteobacteria bacterium]
MPVKKELLEILACPKCKGPVREARKGDGLVCESCGLFYEVKDDIPVMIVEEARPAKEGE